MKCVKLVLSNFCKHQYKEIDFKDGLTAIIGPNGSGKSNIMNAVCFALTGENPYAGNKAANICYNSPPTARSFVQLVFSHGGVTATVQRNLRPERPAATLLIDGEKQITGETEVTRRIEQILGVPAAVLRAVVIVAQKDILGFLDESPAKRAELFQKLFNTEIAAALYKVIGDQLKTVEIPVLSADRDEIQSQLDALARQFTSLSTSLAGIPSFEQLQQQRDDYQRLIHQSGSRRQLLNQIAHTTQQLNSEIQLQLDGKQRLTVTQTDRDTVQTAADGNAAAADDAKLKLANLSQFKQQQANYEAITRKRDGLNQAIQALQAAAPQQPDVYYQDRSTPTTRLYELRGTLSRLQHFVGSIRGEMAECPTCFTPTTQLKPRIDEAMIQIGEIQPQIAQLEAAIAASDKYDQAMVLFNTRHESFQRELTGLEQSVAALTPPVAVTVDESALLKVLDDARLYADGLKDYNKTISQLTAQIAHHDGQITALSQQLSQQQSQLETIPLCSDQDLQTANEGVTWCDRSSASRRQIEADRLVCQTRTDALNRTLQSTAELAVTIRKRRAWHEFAQAMRDVMHKDAAPRFVSQNNLQRLQAPINEHLEMFGAEYRVQASEGLSFEASFPNGVRQPAERLSPGQQVVLVFSFVVALNLMLAENIGALYLDEPTAWLDEHHIRGFEPVLNRLREFSASRGLQVIIVTHERELSPLFDSVVQL